MKTTMKTKLLSAALTAAALSVTPIANAEVKVTTKGGLKVESEDFSFQLGGRIQYDYNYAELNSDVQENDFDLRRGRLFVKGNVTDDWHYKVNFDVDGGGEQDLYLRYTGFGPLANITIGNQHQAFTLEQLISSKDLSISERSGVTERYLIGRRESIQIHGDADNFHYAANIFTEDGENEDTGFSSRVAYAPFKGNGTLVHLGASYKDTQEQDAFGLELAGVAGPAHFQAEYFSADETNEETGIEDDIDGYYAQVGYFITGEIRPYKKGTFKRIKPSNPFGAWEVVARYSDGDGDYGDIELGATDASVIALGVNYYPSYNVRINASYMDGESNITDDDGSEFRVRFQVAF